MLRIRDWGQVAGGPSDPGCSFVAAGRGLEVKIEVGVREQVEQAGVGGACILAAAWLLFGQVIFLRWRVVRISRRPVILGRPVRLVSLLPPQPVPRRHSLRHLLPCAVHVPRQDPAPVCALALQQLPARRFTATLAIT